MKRLIVAVSLFLIAADISFAEERIRKQALTCSAMLYVMTSIPSELLMEIGFNRQQAAGFNQQVGQLGKWWSQIYSVFEKATTGGKQRLSVGMVADARDQELKQLAKIYESNDDELVREYVRCNRWRALAVNYFLKHEEELNSDDSEVIQARVLKIPAPPREVQFNQEEELNTVAFITAAFETFKLMGSPTRSIFKEQLKEFLNNAENGKSDDQRIHTFPDGGKYVGGWKDGQMHGDGTYTWPSGSKYTGEWSNNKKHGKGSQTYADGHEYVGEWKNNQHHGQGTSTFPDGRRYVGEYKNNKWDGQGTLTWANGSRYAGEFKDGRPWTGTGYDKDGNAVVTYSEGVQKSGN